eukprot:449848-Rhodomonas_salina.1
MYPKTCPVLSDLIALMREKRGLLEFGAQGMLRAVLLALCLSTLSAVPDSVREEDVLHRYQPFPTPTCALALRSLVVIQRGRLSGSRSGLAAIPSILSRCGTR